MRPSLLTALVFAAMLALVPACGRAQATAEPAAHQYTGCVVPWAVDPKILIFSGHRKDAESADDDGICAQLAGKFSSSELANHEATLTGSFVEAVKRVPAHLDIKTTDSIGGACSHTCTLHPPGTRSIHGHENPGSEGGRPGVDTTPNGAPPQ